MDIGIIERDREGFVVCIPYWTIVIPLTLLSAYLLISKPRKVKPAAISEE